MPAGAIAVPTIIPLRLPTGSAKNIITEKTMIEISSGTPDTEIFLTLDGSVPEPFAKGLRARATLRYDQPFCMGGQPSGGKVQIKAVAVSRDGNRQSKTITKEFSVITEDGDTVSWLGGAWYKAAKPFPATQPSRGNDTTVDRRHGPALEIKASTIQPRVPESRNGAAVSQAQSASHGLSSWKAAAVSQLHHPRAVSAVASGHLRMSNRQIYPAAVSTPCTNCGAPRPATGTYCNECGFAFRLAQSSKQHRSSTLSTAASTRDMGTCGSCGSYVPLNLDKCVVCETDFGPQLRATSSTSSGVRLCPTCKGANPVHRKECLVCEAPLNGKAKPPVATTLSKRQVNETTKSPKKLKYCPRCFTPLADSCHFCPACGTMVTALEVPAAIPGVNIALQQHLQQGTNNAIATTSSERYQQWPVNFQLQQQAISAAKPAVKLTAKSPGRGYWRQQLDHVAAHSKHFASKNPDFAHDVSLLPLAKLLDAHVELLNDQAVLRICLDFEVVPDTSEYANDMHPDDPVRARRPRYLDAVLESSKRAAANRAERTTRSLGSSRSSSRSRPVRSPDRQSTRSLNSLRSDGSRSSVRPPRKQPTKDVSPETESLWAVLADADKDQEELARVLEEGADPNAKDPDGIPPVGIAVQHLFSEAAKYLKQYGANLDIKYGPYGNTAVHEAVALGPIAETVLRALLTSGANADLKNARKQTPTDVALKTNQQKLADIITTHLSHQILLGQKS